MAVGKSFGWGLTIGTVLFGAAIAGVVAHENNISPGDPDQGQPTHFLPRRNRFVFKVRVPKDWGKKELVWTVTTKGKTERAYGTLREDSPVDNLVQASEQGALGAGISSPEIRANQPPTHTLDGGDRRAQVGQPLTLIAFAITVGSQTGLRHSCFVYRGAGRVTFTPTQAKVWEDTRAGANSPWAPRWMAPAIPADGKYTVSATFQDPGTYTIRCLASDGALNSPKDVVVTVSK